MTGSDTEMQEVMDADNEDVELVEPAAIRKGDVIADPIAQRWLTVHEVQLMEDANAGTYRFFGDGPGDRVAFEQDERVKRRTS